MRRFGKGIIIGVLGAVLLTAGCSNRKEEPQDSPEVQAKIEQINKDTSLTAEQRAAKIEAIQGQAAPPIPSMGGGGTAAPR
jgi:outer membrane murein-binding lipoprotein Lpp